LHVISIKLIEDGFEEGATKVAGGNLRMIKVPGEAAT